MRFKSRNIKQSAFRLPLGNNYTGSLVNNLMLANPYWNSFSWKFQKQLLLRICDKLEFLKEHLTTAIPRTMVLKRFCFQRTYHGIHKTFTIVFHYRHCKKLLGSCFTKITILYFFAREKYTFHKILVRVFYSSFNKNNSQGVLKLIDIPCCKSQAFCFIC